MLATKTHRWHSKDARPVHLKHGWVLPQKLLMEMAWDTATEIRTGSTEIGFFCCLWVKMGVLTGGALLHNGQGEQLPSCMPLSLQNKGNALPNYSQNQSANGMFWNFGLIKKKKNYSSGVGGTLSAQQSLCPALRKQWKWQFSNMLCTAVMQK